MADPLAMDVGKTAEQLVHIELQVEGNKAPK